MYETSQHSPYRRRLLNHAEMIIIWQKLKSTRMVIYLLTSFYQVLMILTAQKMKFAIKDFFSKCDQIRSFLRICSHLLKKSLTESFILCAVSVRKSNFPSSLKIANIIAVCILKSWHIFMSDVFFVKYTIFCLNSCQDSISAIVTIHSIAC